MDDDDNDDDVDVLNAINIYALALKSDADIAMHSSSSHTCGRKLNRYAAAAAALANEPTQRDIPHALHYPPRACIVDAIASSM